MEIFFLLYMFHVFFFSSDEKILIDSSSDSSNPFVGLAFKLEVHVFAEYIFHDELPAYILNK